MTRIILTTLAGVCCAASLNVALAAQSSELTTNGDFELGDTSSWVYFGTPNSTFAATMDANSGNFAGQVFNPDQAAAAVIKQANLGVGVVSPGDMIQISFAAKGSFAAGGVAFAEFFSELAGGGTSSSVLLGNGPLNLTGNWQTFSFVAVAGPNVSGGITLQIAAVTGANIGSFADVLVDDVSVSLPGLGTAYCAANPNSLGAPGSISASGSIVAADNDVTLLAEGLPPNAFGFFLASTTQAFVMNPSGSAGNLCLGGAIGRYVGPGQIMSSGAAGSFSLALDLTTTPTPTGPVAVTAGQTWNFQAWHRDSSAGVATSNFTGGLEIAFQ